MFTEMVLKIASRCDLACSDCYMYELGDDTWKQQPHFMELDVAAVAADRVAEHVRKHHIDKFAVILHGGEPLLAGITRIRAIITAFTAVSPPGVLYFAMQSNGTQLTERMLRELPAGFAIGISLDGDAQATARHRLRPDGSSSHAAVLRALALLRKHPGSYGGLLSVIDTRNDPTVVYRALREQEPPRIDFLLPLATRDSPPAGRSPAGGEYGRWLAAVFDEWYLDNDPRAPDVRTFAIIIDRMLGRDRRSTFIGAPPDVRGLVVQPDGSAELLDALRVTGNGRAQTKLSVLTSTLDEIGQHPGYAPPAPCAACEACPVYTMCGGGYYPHRYSAGNGYDNPSVYCADLMYLIRHIRKRLEDLERKNHDQ